MSAGLRGVSRRRWLRESGVALSLLALPLRALAAPGDVATLLEATFGNRSISEGRVNLSLPALAENGNSVAMTVSVDSPMSEADHVLAVHVFAEENPLPKIAEFRFSPLSGRAAVTTRIRLADSQKVMAVAEMSDGSLHAGAAEIIVTEAACLDFLI